MEGIMELIGNVGFPIGVSFYLLIRIESKMEVLITSINNLSNAVSRLEQNK